MDEVMRVQQEVREREWMEKIKECRGSGKTVKAWCEENGITRKTYYNHLRIVRERLCEEHAAIGTSGIREQQMPVSEHSRMWVYCSSKESGRYAVLLSVRYLGL